MTTEAEGEEEEWKYPLLVSMGAMLNQGCLSWKRILADRILPLRHRIDTRAPPRVSQLRIRPECESSKGREGRRKSTPGM
jgi:hypothetical protein